MDGHCVATTERAEADVDQRLVLILLETRNVIGLFLSYAAFEILKTFGIEWVAAVELYRLGIKQQVQVRRHFKELSWGIRRLAILGEKAIEAFMDRGDDLLEALLKALEAGMVLLAAARKVRRDVRIR